MNLQQSIQQALDHHKSGRRDQAQALYRQILASEPKAHAVMFMLAALLMEGGELPQALDLLTRAARLNPQAAEYQNALGSALFFTHKLPDSAAAFRAALKLRPHYLDAYLGLSRTLIRLGDPRQAADVISRAIAVKPDLAPAHTELANALRDCGDLEKARTAALKAVQIDPNFAWGHNILGMIHHDLDQFEPALNCFREAIRLRPELSEAYLNMAQVRRSSGHLSEAAAALRKAAQLAPRDPRPSHNLGVVLSEIGANEQAITSFRTALNAHPGFSEAHSALLLTMSYHPSYSPSLRFDEHLRWNRQHAASITPLPPAINDKKPGRLLRIGYVSPDFCSHPVSWFIEPILKSHDRSRFEIVLYSDVTKPDEITARLKPLAAAWRDISAMGHDAAAQLVRRDRIDILVDLAGHTRRGRLLMFARKPAPVQVTWLGYPNSTGVTAIDYRLTDDAADPPGESDALHTEQLIRLPNGFLCYAPPSDAPPVSGGSPLAQSGRGVTFASFNNQSKLTEKAISTWSRILLDTPGSRLLLKNRALGDAAVLTAVAAAFARQNIERDRLDLRPPAAGAAAHLATYNDADIALDTFPYNGTTTTCEALWMGVPVIALAGDNHASRVGVSLLSRVGLQELIAANLEDYLRLAVELAANPARLAQLRGSLRQRLAASPLLKAPLITRDIESAYQSMWQTWCAPSP